MPGTTARLALPYPLLTESGDGPAAFLALANALDAAVLYGQGLLSARLPSSGGTPGIQGRIYRATDVANVIYYDNGVGWDAIGLVAHASSHLPGGSDPLTATQLGGVSLAMLVALGG